MIRGTDPVGVGEGLTERDCRFALTSGESLPSIAKPQGGHLMKKFLPVLLALAPTTAGAVYSRDLGIGHRPQENRCWCSIAIVDMWTRYLTNEGPNGGQAEVAREQGVNCDVGLSADGLADALEDETPNWFSSYITNSRNSFAAKIVNEVNARTPVAVAGFTRYSDQAPKAMKHWFLVDAFRNTGANFSSAWANISGYFVNDPAYNTGFAWTVVSTAPDTFITRDVFFRDYASTYNRPIFGASYALVED